MASSEPRTGRKKAPKIATLALRVNPPRLPARIANTTPRAQSARSPASRPFTAITLWG